MANFPADLRCSSLALLAGGFEGRSHSSAAGNVVTVQATNQSVNAQLRVGFRNITAANVATLRGHYEGEGTTNSWLLSAVLLDGAEYAAELATTRWRYVRPLIVKDIDSDVHDVELALEQVPVNFWVERYILNARPATVAAGEATRLIGPDQPPALWVSRLTTTATFGSGSNAGPRGSIRYGANGETFQAFWFSVGSNANGARLVAVKRAANGLIIWQRWTSVGIPADSSGLNADLLTSESFAPQVLPMPDGGCVVAGQYGRVISSTSTTRMWRLSNAGAVAWEKEYAGVLTGPANLALNNGAIVMITESNASILTPTNFSARKGPALVRINATDGSVLSARVYRFGTQNNFDYFSGRSDILVLPDGRMVFKCNRDNIGALLDVFFAEVSEDTATVHKAHGYKSNSSSGMVGDIARLPDGGYLSAESSIGRGSYVRLNSDFSIAAQYTLSVLGGSIDIGSESLQMRIDSSGNGYSVRRNFNDFSVSKLVGNGATLSNFSRVIISSSTLTPVGSVRREAWETYDIDLIRRTGVVTSMYNGPTCHVSAIGFLLEQPTSTNANVNAAAATLDTGSCSPSNIMSVRGWENPSFTSTALTDPFVHTPNVDAISDTFTLTASDATITMVDASASLTWARSVLIA